ncbi:MAG: YfiT family bacillithiol transferase [Gemmatimonadales bacterium]
MPPDLRYPIGRHVASDPITVSQRSEWIAQLAEAPDALRAAVGGLSAARLDTPYRPNGWTVRQVVHHVPDSHLNAYCRFKLALTEEAPVIRPYDEKLWARLPDTAGTPIETSLRLLEALHERWVILLKAMNADDWQRTFVHPEYEGSYRLDHLLGLYAWHGRHHVAHITSLREREGW